MCLVLNLFGKLHPLIVHLPIGILLLNVALIFITRNEKYASAKSILPLTLLLGALSAMAACTTGLLLSQNGDYSSDILNYHKWLGIIIAVGSLLMYYFKQQENRVAGITLAILLMITGHFGGTLTHGENYLFSTDAGINKKAHQPIVDLQKALIYKDLVKPVLQEKCVSCHNANKLKGKLRLDEPDFILKGGKNGVVVVAGKAGESELIKRLLLELNEKHHMPPKGKPQPTENEIALLKWWIAEGCSFDKKVAEVAQNESIKSILAVYQKEEAAPKVNEFIPLAKVEKADEKALDALKKLGIMALPIEVNSPYLSVNFISAPNTSDSVVQQLQTIAKQVAWLKLNGTNISNTALQNLAQMTNLTRLALNNTPIEDISALANLKELRYLSLVGTKVTTQSLNPLQKLLHLQQLYLFNTSINQTDSITIQTLLPKTKLDFGNYQVATLVSDTSVLKSKK